MKTYKQFINENKEEDLSEEIELFRRLSHIDELEIKFEFIWEYEYIYYFYNKKLLFMYDRENGFFDINKDIYDTIFKTTKFIDDGWSPTEIRETNANRLMNIVEEVFDCYLIDCATIDADKKTDIENCTL